MKKQERESNQVRVGSRVSLTGCECFMRGDEFLIQLFSVELQIGSNSGVKDESFTTFTVLRRESFNINQQVIHKILAGAW